MAQLLQLVSGIPRTTTVSGDSIYTQTITNNQSTPANITGAVIDSGTIKVFTVDYSIVRTTASSNVIEEGSFSGLYFPLTTTWTLSGQTYSGNDAGITFSITSGGQLQYVSSNISGTPVLSYMKLSIKTL